MILSKRSVLAKVLSKRIAREIGIAPLLFEFQVGRPFIAFKSVGSHDLDIEEERTSWYCPATSREAITQQIRFSPTISSVS